MELSLWSLVRGFSVLVLLTITTVAGQSPVFLVNPVSVAAVDGTTVEFTCTAENADEINYRVNETSATFKRIQKKGFKQHPDVEELGNMVLRRNLTVTVSSLYNNTEIHCVASPNDINSLKAVLTIQGPLSSFGDLSHSFINFSTINISWSPPFTLPGTTITGYNISVTSNGTTTNYFTSDSYYVLQLSDITDSPCNEINITVSGYNGLDGEKSSPLKMYLPSVPAISPTSVDVSDMRERNNTVSITLFVNVTDLCPGERPNLIDIEIYDSGTLTQFANLKNLSFYMHSMKVEDFSVAAGRKYNCIVFFRNFKGYFPISATLKIYTYAVQSLKIIDDTSPNITLECQFAPHSEAIGCKGVILSLENGKRIGETSANRSGNIAVLIYTNIPSGNYSLNIFDVNKDDSINFAFRELLVVLSNTSTPVLVMNNNSVPEIPIDKPTFSTATLTITIGVLTVVLFLLTLLMAAICIWKDYCNHGRVNQSLNTIAVVNSDDETPATSTITLQQVDELTLRTNKPIMDMCIPCITSQSESNTEETRSKFSDRDVCKEEENKVHDGSQETKL